MKHVLLIHQGDALTPGRHPEGGERPRNADGLVRAPLVEEPLHRRQQIVVALLELLEQRLAIQAHQPWAGHLRKLEKRFRRSRIHESDHTATHP